MGRRRQVHAPILRGSKSDGTTARHARDIFEQHELKDWSIESMTYDQASTAAIQAKATVNDQEAELRFRMVLWTIDGNVGIPGRDEGAWSLAVWAPHTYFQEAS